MNAKLIEMLETAKFHLEKSVYWFDQSQDDEYSWQWHISLEHDSKARGILEAYHILTGNKVDPFITGIRAEIASLSERI